MFAEYCFNFYYLNEIRVKENSNLDVSTFLTMEDSLLVKTGNANQVMNIFCRPNWHVFCREFGHIGRLRTAMRR